MLGVLVMCKMGCSRKAVGDEAKEVSETWYLGYFVSGNIILFLLEMADELMALIHLTLPLPYVMEFALTHTHTHTQSTNIDVEV